MSQDRRRLHNLSITLSLRARNAVRQREGVREEVSRQSQVKGSCPVVEILRREVRPWRPTLREAGPLCLKFSVISWRKPEWHTLDSLIVPVSFVPPSRPQPHSTRRCPDCDGIPGSRKGAGGARISPVIYQGLHNG